LVHKKIGLCKAFSILSGPFENVLMDFMTYLSKWERINAIFVMVNGSKLAKFAPIQTNTTMVGMAKLLFDM